MMLTDKALQANAITLSDAEELENWIEANLDINNPKEIPQELANAFKVSLEYFEYGKRLN